MATVKRLGIWMDHSRAHLMEFKKETSFLKTISTTFTHEDEQAALQKGESLMHNKRQQQQNVYFKKLKDVIMNFDEVLLFGPTYAKIELLNVVRDDSQFDTIKIEAKSADNMTINEQSAFVKNYFSAQMKS